MPTYSYRCTECGTAFDIQQAFTDDSLTECPTCGGKLRKLFSAVGVTFSGSGFYRNDSRAPEKSSASDKPAADKGATKSEPAAASSAAASTPASSPAPASSSSSKE
jgi:putative FmdB family regulatory protein